VRGARCAGSGRGAHTPSTTRVRRAHSTWPRSAGAEMHCTRLLKPFCRQTVSAAATGAHPLTACGAGVPAQPTSVSRPSPGCRAGRRRGTQADAAAAQVPEPGPGGGQWQSGQPGCGRGTHGALRGQQHRVLQEQEPGLADSSMLPVHCDESAQSLGAQTEAGGLFQLGCGLQPTAPQSAPS